MARAIEFCGLLRIRAMRVRLNQGVRNRSSESIFAIMITHTNRRARGTGVGIYQTHGVIIDLDMDHAAAQYQGKSKTPETVPGQAVAEAVAGSIDQGCVGHHGSGCSTSQEFA